jgi:hypothetical protein
VRESFCDDKTGRNTSRVSLHAADYILTNTHYTETMAPQSLAPVGLHRGVLRCLKTWLTAHSCGPSRPGALGAPQARPNNVSGASLRLRPSAQLSFAANLVGNNELP